jgi:hypothetical protein
MSSLNGAATARPPVAARYVPLTDTLLILEARAEPRQNWAIVRPVGVTEQSVETHIASIIAQRDLFGEPDDHRRVLAVWVWLQGQGKQTGSRPWSRGIGATLSLHEGTAT